MSWARHRLSSSCHSRLAQAACHSGAYKLCRGTQTSRNLQRLPACCCHASLLRSHELQSIIIQAAWPQLLLGFPDLLNHISQLHLLRHNTCNAFKPAGQYQSQWLAAMAAASGWLALSVWARAASARCDSSIHQYTKQAAVGSSRAQSMNRILGVKALGSSSSCTNGRHQGRRWL